SRNQKYLPQ
ncbi:hypothetical protein CP10743SC13_0801B, partial [Chlamydia psittaci 10_743_SC13]